MIVLENLTKVYKSKTARVSTIALKNISLEIESTGLIFIVGKSGCGKSTLLNILGGLDRHDSGEILINGVSMRDFTDNDLDKYRSNNVGFIFQDYNLIDDLNVEENIALAYKIIVQTSDTNEINNLLKV